VTTPQNARNLSSELVNFSIFSIIYIWAVPSFDEDIGRVFLLYAWAPAQKNDVHLINESCPVQEVVSMNHLGWLFGALCFAYMLSTNSPKECCTIIASGIAVEFLVNFFKTMLKNK
jgi:hypothetical protein